MLRSIRKCPACLRTSLRYYSAEPQYNAPSASKSASSAAQPLSTPTTPAPTPASELLSKEPESRSICKEGTVMKGLNIFKVHSDPVAKADGEYPEFLWTLLNQEKSDKKLAREKNRAIIKRKNFFSGKL